MQNLIYRLILCNVFFKMTHVLPLISDQNCDKNALQNRRGRPVLNKIGSLTIVFSVFSIAKICQCTQFFPHHIYKSIKDITMNFGSLIKKFPDLLHETILNAKFLSRVMISAKLYGKPGCELLPHTIIAWNQLPSSIS